MSAATTSFIRGSGLPAVVDVDTDRVVANTLRYFFGSKLQGVPSFKNDDHTFEHAIDTIPRRANKLFQTIFLDFVQAQGDWLLSVASRLEISDDPPQGVQIDIQRFNPEIAGAVAEGELGRLVTSSAETVYSMGELYGIGFEADLRKMNEGPVLRQILLKIQQCYNAFIFRLKAMVMCALMEAPSRVPSAAFIPGFRPADMKFLYEAKMFAFLNKAQDIGDAVYDVVKDASTLGINFNNVMIPFACKSFLRQFKPPFFISGEHDRQQERLPIEKRQTPGITVHVSPWFNIGSGTGDDVNGLDLATTIITIGEFFYADPTGKEFYDWSTDKFGRMVAENGDPIADEKLYVRFVRHVVGSLVMFAPGAVSASMNMPNQVVENNMGRMHKVDMQAYLTTAGIPYLMNRIPAAYYSGVLKCSNKCKAYDKTTSFNDYDGGWLSMDISSSSSASKANAQKDFICLSDYESSERFVDTAMKEYFADKRIRQKDTVTSSKSRRVAVASPYCFAAVTKEKPMGYGFFDGFDFEDGCRERLRKRWTNFGTFGDISAIARKLLAKGE